MDLVWRRLLDRAGQRKSQPVTDEADLPILADRRRLDPVERIGEAHVFQLPQVPSSLRIVSRTAFPVELGLGRDPPEPDVADPA